MAINRVVRMMPLNLASNPTDIDAAMAIIPSSHRSITLNC